MKIYILTILFLLIACSQFASNRTSISKIDFKLHASKADPDVFPNGIVPWINIDSPKKQIDSLINADELILLFNKVRLVIDYPLSNKATFEIEASGNGFSRRRLITIISEKYHEIYKEEERTAREKTLPMAERKGLINRNSTNGKYGICCHDIADLDLESVEVHRDLFGNIFLTLNIES